MRPRGREKSLTANYLVIVVNFAVHNCLFYDCSAFPTTTSSVVGNDPKGFLLVGIVSARVLTCKMLRRLMSNSVQISPLQNNSPFSVTVIPLTISSTTSVICAIYQLIICHHAPLYLFVCLKSSPREIIMLCIGQ
jgi:hypothetical protein